MRRDERGVGTVLTAGVSLAILLVSGMVAMGIAWFSIARQAERVAEVAALAGASAAAEGGAPCSAAREAAAHNGAELARCAVRGRAPDVVVETGVTLELRPHIWGMPQTLLRTASAATL